MFPSPGPPRITSTITQGSSEPTRYETCIRLRPGPEEAVMTRIPVDAAPYTMLMAATSLSCLRKRAAHLRQIQRGGLCNFHWQA